MAEVLGFDDGKHGSEDLFVSQAILWFDLTKNCRADKKTLRWRLPLKQAFPFSFAESKIANDLCVRGRIDNRADKMFWVVWRTDLEAASRFDQPFQQKVVDFVDQDKARGSRTLLTLVAKGRLKDVNHSLVEIGVLIDDDGVLAAHFAHHSLYMLLARLMIVSRTQNFQANLPRSSKSDKLHRSMPYKVSPQFASTLHQLASGRWQLSFVQNLHQQSAH